jgi:hypothetical protein
MAVMKIFVAHASNFNFQDKIYTPIRSSSLNSEFEFILPHEGGRREVTKELIKEAGAIVVDVSRPSTGAGIEMGWANAFSVPIICIYEKGSAVSKSVAYLAKAIIEYENPEDLIRKLSEELHSL